MSFDSPELYPLIGGLVGDAMAFGRDDGGWSVHSASTLALAVGMVQPEYNIFVESPGTDYVTNPNACGGKELKRVNMYVPYRSTENYTWKRSTDEFSNQGLNWLGVIHMKYQHTSRTEIGWALNHTRSILININQSELSCACGCILMLIMIFVSSGIQLVLYLVK